jgi:hypothetical protein
VQQHRSQGPTSLDSLLARLLAAWPNSRLPDASYALYREKLADIPIATVARAVETLIEKGGKTIPHVGEILGLCRQTGAVAVTQQHENVWDWAGFNLEGYQKLSGAAHRLWEERWAARLEAICRDQGRRVPSHFAPEHLDDVLHRLGLDSRGGLIEDLSPGAPRVEDHSTPDTRNWREIAHEAEQRMRERIGSIVERNRERIAIQTAEENWS